MFSSETSEERAHLLSDNIATEQKTLDHELQRITEILTNAYQRLQQIQATINERVTNHDVAITKEISDDINTQVRALGPLVRNVDTILSRAKTAYDSCMKQIKRKEDDPEDLQGTVNQSWKNAVAAAKLIHICAKTAYTGQSVIDAIKAKQALIAAEPLINAQNLIINPLPGDDAPPPVLEPEAAAAAASLLKQQKAAALKELKKQDCAVRNAVATIDRTLDTARTFTKEINKLNAKISSAATAPNKEEIWAIQQAFIVLLETKQTQADEISDRCSNIKMRCEKAMDPVSNIPDDEARHAAFYNLLNSNSLLAGWGYRLPSFARENDWRTIVSHLFHYAIREAAGFYGTAMALAGASGYAVGKAFDTDPFQTPLAVRNTFAMNSAYMWFMPIVEAMEASQGKPTEDRFMAFTQSLADPKVLAFLIPCAIVMIEYVLGKCGVGSIQQYAARFNFDKNTFPDRTLKFVVSAVVLTMVTALVSWGVASGFLPDYVMEVGPSGAAAINTLVFAPLITAFTVSILRCSKGENICTQTTVDPELGLGCCTKVCGSDKLPPYPPECAIAPAL